MSNNINWGKIYESTAWGSGVTDNNISWGKSYADLAGGGGDTFDTDYQAVLDQASSLGYTAPSAAQQTLQNTLVTDLKTAGVWDKLDVFYVFATDGDSDYATLNWKAPSSHQVTKVSSPSFLSNKGFQTNGSSSYLDTNYNPTTDAINYQMENSGRIIYAHPDINPLSRFDGVAGTNNNRMRPANVTSHYLNGQSNFLDGSVDFTGSGFKSITRQPFSNGFARYTLFNNSTSYSRYASNVEVIPNTNQLIARSNTTYGTLICGFYGLGSDFSNEYLDFKSAIDNYNSSL